MMKSAQSAQMQRLPTSGIFGSRLGNIENQQPTCQWAAGSENFPNIWLRPETLF
jgi:hypothetical protein